MILSSSLIWFLVGVAFLVSEILLSGFILIFFTAGCWIVAFVTWVFEIELASQIFVFIASSLTLLFTLRKYSLKIFRGKTLESIDDYYADSKIGKTAVVTKTISPNLPGEIRVMGSFWRANAEEAIEEGQSVRIESQESEDGLTFRVKSLKGGKNE